VCSSDLSNNPQRSANAARGQPGRWPKIRRESA
jgi:hypothetical protein